MPHSAGGVQMLRAFRLVLVISLALFAAGVVFAQDAPETKPAWPAYLFSIFLGLGTGQYWVGGNGNLFLIGEVSCVGFALIGTALALGSPAPTSSSGLSGGSLGYLMIGAGAIVLSIFRIWELINVFGAVDDARRTGKVAALEPVVNGNLTQLEIGVCLHL